MNNHTESGLRACEKCGAPANGLGGFDCGSYLTPGTQSDVVGAGCIHIQNDALRRRVEELEEVVSDWIVDMAQKDNGAVFWKRVGDSEQAPITYGDLRKLMEMDAPDDKDGKS